MAIFGTRRILVAGFPVTLSPHVFVNGERQDYLIDSDDGSAVIATGDSIEQAVTNAFLAGIHLEAARQARDADDDGEEWKRAA